MFMTCSGGQPSLPHKKKKPGCFFFLFPVARNKVQRAESSRLKFNGSNTFLLVGQKVHSQPSWLVTETDPCSVRLIHFEHDKARRGGTQRLPSAPFKYSPEPHSQPASVLFEQDILLPMINTGFRVQFEESDKQVSVFCFPFSLSSVPVHSPSGKWSLFFLWVGKRVLDKHWKAPLFEDFSLGLVFSVPWRTLVQWIASLFLEDDYSVRSVGV